MTIIAAGIAAGAGCGMCAQSGPRDRPLGLIFDHIRQKLLAQTGYKPGSDHGDPLPVELLFHNDSEQPGAASQ
ncbi:MAG: hypothetical protein PVJ75_13115 [Chloroflexota bacterium]